MAGVPTPSATVPEGSAFGLSNSTSSSIRFSPDVLKTFLRKIYGKEFDTSKEIEPTAWREVLRIMNEATVEGLSQSDYQIQPSHSELFLKELRHGNEIFSAFKVHTMAEQMAAKLYDDKGNLKSFERWLSDVESISSHHVGSWLRTEYDTAVIRAHQAADWQQFLQNQDIMPNLRWMPTTSAEPESSHAVYWRSKLTLPISDPFWNDHHPGDRWNCKCSLEQTDEPVVPLSSAEGELPKPQRGLENNPGKDSHLFSDKHPYFPTSCSKCSLRGAQGFTNLRVLFTNAKNDCYSCAYANGMIPKDKDGIKKLTPVQKHEVYSRPLEQQFEKVAPNVKRHIFKAVDEIDYKEVLNAAKIYAAKDEVLIIPEIHASEVEVRAALGVPMPTKIPDLKVGAIWVDVKSPEKYKNITHNANEATSKGAIACVTDERMELNVESLEGLSRSILKNKDYLKEEIHFIVKGTLYKYNSQGLIPG